MLLAEVAVVLFVDLDGVVEGAGAVEGPSRRVQVNPDLLVLQNEPVDDEEWGRINQLVGIYRLFNVLGYKRPSSLPGPK